MCQENELEMVRIRSSFADNLNFLQTVLERAKLSNLAVFFVTFSLIIIIIIKYYTLQFFYYVNT